MKFKSLPDILKFAIVKEESSVLFYRELIEHVKDMNTVAVLEAMACQEEKHVEAVKFELLKLGCTVKDTASPKGASDENEVTPEVNTKVGEMTPVDFMRLGIQKEQASFDLYSQLMVMATDTDARKVFLELAEEEMRHIINLEREIEVLTQPRQK